MKGSTGHFIGIIIAIIVIIFLMYLIYRIGKKMRSGPYDDLLVDK